MSKPKSNCPDSLLKDYLKRWYDEGAGCLYYSLLPFDPSFLSLEEIEREEKSREEAAAKRASPTYYSVTQVPVEKEEPIKPRGANEIPEFLCGAFGARVKNTSPLGSITDYLEDFLDATHTFSREVLRIIDIKHYQDADVYKAAHLDRRVFSRLRKDKNFQPSRTTALALCFALHLNAAQCCYLLSLAGYSPSRNNPLDVICSYFIDRKIYDLDIINEALYNFGLETLGSKVRGDK